MKKYRVVYRENDDFRSDWPFICDAESVEHAIEQTRDAYKDETIKIISVVEQEPTIQVVLLSNGAKMSVTESRDTVSIGYIDNSGSDWWVASVGPNGVLVAPNSGDCCESLANGLNDIV